MKPKNLEHNKSFSFNFKDTEEFIVFCSDKHLLCIYKAHF